MTAKGTSQTVLGTLLLFPQLLESTEELTSALFFGKERRVFEAIVNEWEDSHPNIIDIGRVAEAVGGGDALKYVNELGNDPEELNPETFQARVNELIAYKKLLSEDVRLWITYSSGDFTLPQIYSELGATTVNEKDAVRQVIYRMKESGDVLSVGRGYGKYRRVDKELERVNLLGVPPEPMDIILPLFLDQKVKIYPASILVCAGSTNDGKTAMAHKFIKDNMKKHDIKLFFCEGGPEGLQERLSRHEDLELKDWTFDAYHRTENFEDVVGLFPNSICVIDYLECPGDKPWMIGPAIDAIYRRLERGIVWINIQKGVGREIGRGGDWGMERAQLYLTLSRDDVWQTVDTNKQFVVAKILKAKAYNQYNPEGKVMHFVIEDGWQIKHNGIWEYPPKTEVKKFRK